MRECPHCKAQIGEDARFCLYCMTPLIEKEFIPPQKEKKLWWVFVMVGAVLMGSVAALMLLRDRNPVPSQPSSGSSAVVTTTESTTDSTTDASTDSATGSTTESTEETTTETTTETTAEATTEQVTEPTEDEDGTSALPRFSWKDANTLCTYRYRPAVQSDVLGLDYQVTENDIVVELIEQEKLSNWLVVPSYMDGKRVIAIGAPGYANYSAVKVYLPNTLLAIHDGAMAKDVAELYISGEFLALESDTTVNKTTTVHSLEICQDQYGRKYADFWKDNYMPRWRVWTAQTYGYLKAGNSPPDYINTDGDITILDINWPLEGEIYDIPAYIDGKKVIGIYTSAFRDVNATAIYIPETVRWIAVDAAPGKAKVKDVYFRGDSLEIVPIFMSDRYKDIIFHCSADCVDLTDGVDGLYFKDNAARHGITWEEWNG